MPPFLPLLSMWTLFCLLYLVLFLPFAQCTQFQIPGTWAGTKFNVSRSERIQIARSALSIVLPSINASTGSIAGFTIPSAASLQWVMSAQDWLGNTTTNQRQVTSNFAAIEEIDPNFSSGKPDAFMSDALFLGVSAYYAYRAYKDPVFLNYAKMIWDTVRIYSVTPAQAAAGNSSVRNVTFQSTCKGATTAGAVFAGSSFRNNLYIYGHTEGLFIALSAYLFEQSGNTTYKEYADLTTAFILNNLFEAELVLDFYNIGSCTAAPASSVTLSNGPLIEGWAVFANVTGNSTLKGIVDNLAYTSIISPTWTNNAGVNFEELDIDLDNGENGYKSFLIRGLHTAWQRDDPTSGIAQLIAAYITVQFNALRNQVAQASQSNAYYSSRWDGGPPPSFEPYSQVVALHVLNAAFDLPDNALTNITTNPGNQTSTDNKGPADNKGPTDNNPGGHSHVGAIAGGAGGAVGLGLLAVLGFFTWRRKKRSGPRPMLDPDEPAPATIWVRGEVEPFILPAPTPSHSATYAYQRHTTEKHSAAPVMRYSSSHLNDIGTDTHSPGIGSPSSSAPSQIQLGARDAPASAAEVQRLSEQVNGLISSLAASQHGQHQSTGEQPPVYEQRYAP